MKKDKKIKTEDIFARNIYDIETHKLANMNPMQNDEDFLALKYSIEKIGQTDPILMFKGKLVDGRNRLKALKELYEDTEEEKYKIIKYKKLSTTLSNDELEELIIGKETRRHKSIVQKAIQSLNYYEAKKELKEDINMRESAKKFGVSVGQVSKVLSLKKVAGEAVVQILFNGGSIKIKKAKANGTIYEIKSTSPDAIRKYYEGLIAKNDSIYENMEAEEMAYIQLISTELLNDLSFDGANYLMKIIENSKDINKTSYNKEKIEDYISS